MPYIHRKIYEYTSPEYTPLEIDMSLYIRDNEVDALAKQVQKVIKAENKTEAVRTALRNELERAKQAIPLEERIKKIQDAARAIGPDDPNLDMKKYMDEMWGDI
jgi:antitoxin VapB